MQMDEIEKFMNVIETHPVIIVSDDASFVASFRG